MRVLLTNDDGIQAPGLQALAMALEAAGHDVYVCAPHRERSAAGHSSNILQPLHALPVDYPHARAAWRSDGTPADCARLGLFLTRETRVDMVLSGINRGMNLGGACVYSGTVAAAMEAAMCGTQALAVSLHIPPGETGEDYEPSARLAVRVAEWMREHPLPRGCFYNLNVPSLPYEAIRGLVPATLSEVFLSEADYRVDRDEQGTCYHFMFHAPSLEDPRVDLERVKAGYATLTKLTWDFRMQAEDGELTEIGL